MQYFWAMCRCYVWPTPEPALPGKPIGRCGRCNEPANQLNYMVTTKEEATGIFFENYHELPTPF